MTKHKKAVFEIAFICYAGISYTLHAQQQALTGTFTNANRTITLQLKQVEAGYHGMMVSAAGTFAMQATKAGGGLTGKIYGSHAALDFQIRISTGQLAFSSHGQQETFYHISYEHSLHDVDVSRFFSTNDAGNNTQWDYDHSYSHTNNRQATEKKTKTPSVDLSQPFKDLNKNHSLYPYIAGSQLAHYRSTSMFNKSRASSLTYVNFCPNGNFTRTYDGSFTIASTHHNDINALGASIGRNSGNWNIEENENGIVIKLFFSDGRTDFYRINKPWAEAGSWRIGNDKYAIQRGKVTCN